MRAERSALAFAAALAIGGAGCARDWSTDMWFQPSVRAEDAPREEPDGSVSLDSPDPVADRDDADASLTNPRPADATAAARGARTFHDRCACCHGPKGHGDGPVSKLFPQAPDLRYAVIRARSDGYLWGTVTFGGRVMPPQAEGLSVDDRWDVVDYVRTLQTDTSGAAAP